MSKQTSVEDFKQLVTFQSLRTSILARDGDDRLDQPLAYWAVTSDRRLPMALMERSLRHLLNTSFDDLRATPGIGRKKVGSMILLLNRAAKELASKTAKFISPAEDRLPRSKTHPDVFDSGSVSELHWQQWRDTAKRHGIGSEKLGRLAATLEALPSVIWTKPLSDYFEYTLAQMRRLKTHGEKRVNAVLEVFFAVHQILGAANSKSHLTLRLIPKFIRKIEQCISEWTERHAELTDAMVRDYLAIPLIDQLQIDCGNAITRLVEERLGLHGAPQTVKSQAKRLGVTRARVYQLLEQCAMAMEVRWPEGRSQLIALREKVKNELTDGGTLQLLDSIMALLFPAAESEGDLPRADAATSD
jgi:hypothetical protein